MDENQELNERFEQLTHALNETDIQKFREVFLDLHIYEQGQFYQSLDESQRQIVYTYLSPKELADMFDVIEEDDEHMTEYLSEMRPGYAADMLAEMYTDNAVDLLNTLDKKQVAKYLSLMPAEDASEIKDRVCFDRGQSNGTIRNVCPKKCSRCRRNDLLYLCRRYGQQTGRSNLFAGFDHQ